MAAAVADTVPEDEARHLPVSQVNFATTTRSLAMLPMLADPRAQNRETPGPGIRGDKCQRPIHQKSPVLHL